MYIVHHEVGLTNALDPDPNSISVQCNFEFSYRISVH